MDYRTGVDTRGIAAEGADARGADSDLQHPTINAINDKAQANNVGVTARLNSSGTGILLEDTTGGSQTLTVTDLNSSAAADLKIVGKAKLVGGKQTIDGVGAFHVKKVAGAKEDGVKTGAELCYRCKLGDRPVVMVFARTPDEKLAGLLKALDKQVGKHKEEKLSSFVNLIGKDEKKLGSAGEKLAEEAELENVAVVVPVDQPNGPVVVLELGLEDERVLSIAP